MHTTGLCGKKKCIWSKISVRTRTEVVRIGTIRSHFLNKTTFTESRCDCYYGPEYVDLVQTMVFEGIIWTILVLSSTLGVVGTDPSHR